MTLLCAYENEALQRRFCHAGEADLQEYARNIYTGIFVQTLSYYYCERDAHTDAPCLVHVNLLACSNYDFNKIFCCF